MRTMKTRSLKISDGLWIELMAGEGWYSLTFEYIEPSQDHWHSDQCTDVEIDAAKAREIIDFLAPFAE